MSIEDAELLKEFSIESREHLSDIENQLFTLEAQGETSNDADVADHLAALERILSGETNESVAVASPVVEEPTVAPTRPDSRGTNNSTSIGVQ